MKQNRVEIMLKALEQLGVGVGRLVRYGNDTGTCIRCVTGTMVMVPDDPSVPYFLQAGGAEALQPRLEPLFDRLLADAVEASNARGARGALQDAAEALYQEGFEAGQLAALASARVIFESMAAGKYGALPPSVSNRIRQASFAELERWADKLRHARHATTLVM